jgi:predicted  nucleic acid-binding Zn-ribbon protein
MSGKKVDLDAIPCNSKICPVSGLKDAIDDIKDIQKNDIEDIKESQKAIYKLLTEQQVLITKFDVIQKDLKKIDTRISNLEKIQRDDVREIHKKIEKKVNQIHDEFIVNLHSIDEEVDKKIKALKIDELNEKIEEKLGKKDIIIITSVISFILTTALAVFNFFIKSKLLGG